MDQSAQMKLTAPTLSVTDFNLPSLHLLHDEIIATLKDTEIHLSEFNDDSSQAPLLSDSISVLKQLSCIFKLISLVGAEVLNNAIVDGLQRLYDNGDNNDTALIMDLSEAIMTLDRYVEFVLLTESVEPTLLLPVVNNLNAHGQKPPMTVEDFSTFGSSSVIIANPEKNFEPLSALNLDTKLLTYAYRSGLGVALLNQDGNIDSNDQQKLDAMSAACALIASNSNSLFWQAAATAVTDIAAVLPLNVSQKHTLIYVEQQFQSYLPVMDTRFADLVNFACQRDTVEGTFSDISAILNNQSTKAQLYPNIKVSVYGTDNLIGEFIAAPNDYLLGKPSQLAASNNRQLLFTIPVDNAQIREITMTPLY